MGQPKLFSIIDKAVFDYKMIEKGDRILIGASGGKDSTALVEYFSNRLKRKGADFSFTAIHIETDFEACTMSPRLREQMREWNVDTLNYFVDVENRVKEGFKMSCYWCSQQRRNELVHYALKHGYNKIALGHHLDDILETLLMNVLRKGELSTMPPRLNYQKYPLSIIRPLCYADVETIKEHAAASGYISTTCTCMYQDNSGRKDARARLQALTNGDRRAKEKIFEALRNINKEYLP
ncbi:tRNA 2-thiocytidine biosynthesis TtcA family protein [Treponema zioleckii]|uniref:tRNA 2-thiocytidine biosynthesis TtcA family protein n=1 Tax=Treponema zioleckii TaxID=331680 RepID=UPI00168A6C41|nr:tRNA 2-thiocytidine biosynthesis TtcA family protein [Treponema zioleckii]